MIIVWQGVVKKILNKKDQESPNFRLPYYNTAWKSSVLALKKNIGAHFPRTD